MVCSRLPRKCEEWCHYVRLVGYRNSERNWNQQPSPSSQAPPGNPGDGVTYKPISPSNIQNGESTFIWFIILEELCLFRLKFHVVHPAMSGEPSPHALLLFVAGGQSGAHCSPSLITLDRPVLHESVSSPCDVEKPYPKTPLCAPNLLSNSPMLAQSLLPWTLSAAWTNTFLRSVLHCPMAKSQSCPVPPALPAPEARLGVGDGQCSCGSAPKMAAKGWPPVVLSVSSHFTTVEGSATVNPSTRQPTGLGCF